MTRSMFKECYLKCLEDVFKLVNLLAFIRENFSTAAVFDISGGRYLLGFSIGVLIYSLDCSSLDTTGAKTGPIYKQDKV